MKYKNFQHIINGLLDILPFLDLRPAQLDVFNEFISQSVDNRFVSGFFDLATGFGKTRMMNVLTEAFLSQNPDGKVVIVEPTAGLILDENGDGMLKRFRDFHQMYHHEPLDIGAFYQNSKDKDKNVIVTTYASLSRLVQEINPQEIGLLLLDEAHHSLSDIRIEAVEQFSNACRYGLTATPEYSPDKHLKNLLGDVISEIRIVQAIKDGLLCSCKNILLSSKIRVDLSQVSKTKQGDYNPDELEEILKQALLSYQAEGNVQNWNDIHELIAHEIALFYQRYVDETIGEVRGKKCIINCRSQSEALLQVRALNKLFGKNIAGVWTTDTKDKTILSKFVQGPLLVLCQVGKLSEGFDMPELDMCINYPTCSKVMEAQRGGRVLRLNPHNQHKFALIVDVVFSHPEFDNPILSSHANGQVLYRDIMDGCVVGTPRPQINIPNLIVDNQDDKEQSPSKRLSFEMLEVFSDVEDLITLENEAEIVWQNEYALMKRNGMKTANDLGFLFRKDSKFFRNLLQKCYRKGITFEVDGIIYPLVEQIKFQKGTTVVLHEHEKALDTLIEIALQEGKDLTLPMKRIGMKSCSELGVLLKKDMKFFTVRLQRYYDEGVTFTVNGVTYPLVERVRSHASIILALNEHEQALHTLKELVLQEGEDLTLPRKRKGMKTSHDLARIFKKGTAFLKNLLEQAFLSGCTFVVNGQILPLVEQIKSNRDIVYALHEHKKALLELKKFALLKGINLDIPEKRKGMKSSVDLALLLRKEKKIFIDLLKRYYDAGCIFTINGVTYPLVERVKSGTHVVSALHEHEQALVVFKQLAKADGIDLDITPKRKGMKSGYDLSKLLKKGQRIMLALLQQCYETGCTFCVDGISYPLVERVQSASGPIYALNEHEQALPILKAFALRNGVNLDILPKRRGMRTSLDLRNLFVSSQKFFVDLLQRYYQEGHTFIVDGAVYPLVEQVQSGVRSVYVLHEHEQALEELVSLANKEGVVLKKRKVSTHQQQNHTPVNDYQRN